MVVHTPPRHGKTETLLHFIPWLLWHRPDWTVGYCSYNDAIASSKSRVALDLAQRSKLPLVTTGVREWRTPDRGGCLAVGIGGGLTGHGLNVGIVDDPVKNRIEAESATYRERTWSWFRDVFLTRIEPNGSVIVNMARWHPEDLAGMLLAEGWEYLCLPAITTLADGSEVPLWPDQWPLAELAMKRSDLGIYSWESLYQGSPRPRGGTVFGDPWGYAKLPEGAKKLALGIDLAFAAKTSSDYSVIVVMAFSGGYYYVLDVLRAQMRAPQFAEVLRQYRNRHQTARTRWYAAGTELGAADFVQIQRDFKTQTYVTTPFEALPPKGDKFTRAIGYAAAWNAGRVLVPEDSEAHPWVNQFLVEHANFTGVDDNYDDQVDAAVAAFDSLAGAYDDDTPPVRFQRRM